MLFTKGIEEEFLIGTRGGMGVNFSAEIQRNVCGFVRELDGRMTEYGTKPCECYECIAKQMLAARRRLRKYLSSRGDISIIPGGTLPIDPRNTTYATDKDDPYYGYLLGKFSTRAVAAGSHLNLGVEDPDLLMRLYRVTKLEAPLYIALTASSPFLNGRATGCKSTRWFHFPQEPFPVPFFKNHQEYILWTEERLRSNEMMNVRHLWTSLRPNGDCRPYEINRLELRVCDSNADPRITLAALALLESRAGDLASQPWVDVERVPARFLAAKAVRESELAVSRDGLDAEIFRWDTEQACSVRSWIEDLYKKALERSADPNQTAALKPIESILEQGNAADRWLQDLNQGRSIAELVSETIVDMEVTEASMVGELVCANPTSPCAHQEQFQPLECCADA